LHERLSRIGNNIPAEQRGHSAEDNICFTF
jgi:hypothetical protein